MAFTPPRAIVWLTCVAAVVVFAAVQDRVTAAGARRYVALQRAALAGVGEPITIQQVMDTAVARSVRIGGLSAGAVLVVGFGAIAASSRARRRVPPSSPRSRARAAR